MNENDKKVFIRQMMTANKIWETMDKDDREYFGNDIRTYLGDMVIAMAMDFIEEKLTEYEDDDEDW